jgi:hypothetical protein
MAMHRAIAFISFIGIGSALAPPAESQEPASQTAADGYQSGNWLFPVERLNQRLSHWLKFGGEFRMRLESEDGIAYKPTNDTYLLSQFRFNLTIQPTKWFTLFAETQDSRTFFNQHVPDAVPFQNTWDIRQAYVQIGSSKEGWADVVVGRQVFSFGDERVIGPSDWLNMGRTFDAVRLDLHHTGYRVSFFASSVALGVDGQMDHHQQGNTYTECTAALKMQSPAPPWSPTSCGGLLRGTRGCLKLPTAVISTKPQSARA